MKPFDVYPLYDITPVKAEGSVVWDDKGTPYLDLYGGHAVISIGHTHPHYVARIKEQLDRMAFYSNAVQNPLQQALAEKLGALSGLEDYQLFLCNSGAEANENALKVASMVTGKAEVIAFTHSFHGRTSAVVAVTDNPKIVAPLNAQHQVHFVDFGDHKRLEELLATGKIAAVIVEPIQGVGGLDMPSAEFLQQISAACKAHGAMMIADEVQSGYGRSGRFFAFQHADISPDIVSVAKGMGNGFPIGGILIAPHIEASYGMLGTTFGGNHLACAAALAVLEVIESEGLMRNATAMEPYFKAKAAQIPQVLHVKGRGLMLGLAFEAPVAPLRNRLIHEHHIFTGSASDPKVLRILPALNIKKEHMDQFFDALTQALA